MENSINDKIKPVAERSATERGLNVLHFVGRGTATRPVLEITLDGDRLVSVEDCEIVSRCIQEFIDEHLGESVNYRLDVLSPGVDESIIYNYQLKRSIGRILKIRCLESEVETDVLGVLRSFSDSTIELEQQKTLSRGQKPKVIGTLIIERSTIVNIRQVAVIR